LETKTKRPRFQELPPTLRVGSSFLQVPCFKVSGKLLPSSLQRLREWVESGLFPRHAVGSFYAGRTARGCVDLGPQIHRPSAPLPEGGRPPQLRQRKAHFLWPWLRVGAVGASAGLMEDRGEWGRGKSFSWVLPFSLSPLPPHLRFRRLWRLIKGSL
jgi:hypothetical protein